MPNRGKQVAVDLPPFRKETGERQNSTLTDERRCIGNDPGEDQHVHEADRAQREPARHQKGGVGLDAGEVLDFPPRGLENAHRQVAYYRSAGTRPKARAAPKTPYSSKSAPAGASAIPSPGSPS